MEVKQVPCIRAVSATVFKILSSRCGTVNRKNSDLYLYCVHDFHPFDPSRNSSLIHSKGCYSVAKETQDMSVIGSAVSRQPILPQTDTHTCCSPYTNTCM